MLTKRHLARGVCPRFLDLVRRHASSDAPQNYDDYNYFKPSLLPTDHFQYSLPSLPIPKLDATCERYLLAVKPILNDDDKAFEQTRRLVDDFRSGDGKRLDAQLRQKNAANRTTSYISKPWFDMYLKSRLPLVLNSNFFIVFADDPQKSEPAARLTNYIIASVRFMNSLRTNTLAPEVFHLNPKKSNNEQFRQYLRYVPERITSSGTVLRQACPRDMSQYDRLFNSTRIPKIGCDVLQTSTERTRHVVVIKRGHYYKVNILDENGQLLPAEKIASVMKYLREELNEKENQHPLGYFTADNRDRWALTRAHIEALSEHNKRVFQQIDGSIMVICLDEDDPSKLQRTRYVVGQCLCYNAANRWYDKSLNMIMLSDGTLGLNCEHSWGDGVTLLRFCNDIDQDANTQQRITASIEPSTHGCVEKLEFQLDDKTKSDLPTSKHTYDDLVAKLNVSLYEEAVLGKNLLKKRSFSPDAIMQIGFQMAYFKMRQRFVSTYESCSTAVYKHGRTETIRPVTNETKAFIEATVKSTDARLKKELLKKSSEKHQQLIREAATGHGFDRHLLALKYLQQTENNEPELHPIYTDRPYHMMNHTILSTSTVTSKHIAAIGFGPVVDDGLGVSYLIDDEHCRLLVTSYMSKELDQFVQAAAESYEELARIIRS